MTKHSMALLFCIITSVCLRADIDTGSWSLPFEGRNCGNIRSAQCAGSDCIWFATDSGIGQMHIVSQAARFFNFDSLTIQKKYGIVAAGGDECAAFACEGGDVYRYDGKEWKKISAPASFSALTIAADGHIWAGNDSALFRYDSAAWMKFPLPTPGAGSAPKKLIEDDSGAVWFADDNNRIFRCGGTTIKKVAVGMLPGKLSPLTLFKYCDGKICAFGGNSFFTLDSSKLLQFTIDSATTGLYARRCLNGIEIVKETPKNHAWYQALRGSPAFFCGGGVILMDQKGFKYFDDNKQSFSYLSVRTLLWNNSGGNISGHFGMTFLYCKKDSSTWFSYNGGKSVVKSKNGVFIELPPLDYAVNCLLEYTNGNVLAGTSNGLFFYNGTQWERSPGLENIGISKLALDKSGKLWGTSSKYILRQNDLNWELIDNGNSDIGTVGYGDIVTDDSGAIWVSLTHDSGCAAKTFDGYHWTVHAFSGAQNLPSSFSRILRKDPRGNIELIYYSGKVSGSESQCSTIVKAVFEGGKWHCDSIRNPAPQSSIACQYFDGWGDLWFYRSSNDTGSTGFFRYTNGAWLRYDLKNAPFVSALVSGEAPTGELYVIGANLKIYAFKRHYSAPIMSGLSAASLGRTAFSARSAVGSGIVVDYTLKTPGNVFLRLYSLQGKLIRTFVDGYRAKGAHSSRYAANDAKGAYIIRLFTPDARLAAKIILK
jgi:ligand-binding sensor domain-containing protein